MRPASDAEKARLNDTFAALCRIPSPFGHERACSDHVRRELRGMGIEAAGGRRRGNLLARIPGRGERSILLCAHLDTVDDGGVPIDPVIVDGGWENANEGILGADNKAAVAVILELARRCSVEGSPVGIELLFTVSEENALAGAKAVRRRAAAVRLRLRLRPRDADRRGRDRVADLLPRRRRLPRPRRPRRHPPRGRPLGDPRRRPRDRGDAARAHRRADDRQRRLDPGRRGLHQHRAGALPASSPRRARWTRAGSRTSSPAWSTRSTTAPPTPSATSTSSPSACSSATGPSRARRRSSAAEAALRACGYEPRRIVTGGGSDANVLEVEGFSCVNLANGTERNHEPTERVAVAALEGMLDVALRAARRGGGGMSSRFERIGRRDPLRGQGLQRHRGDVPPRGRRGVHARDRPPQGRRRRRLPRRRADLPRPPAARGGRRRPTCSSCRRASSTSRGRSRSRPPSASSPRRSARPPSTGSTCTPSTPRPASPTRSATSTSPPACRTRRPRPTSTSASTSRRGRSPSSTR